MCQKHFRLFVQINSFSVSFCIVQNILDLHRFYYKMLLPSNGIQPTYEHYFPSIT